MTNRATVDAELRRLVAATRAADPTLTAGRATEMVFRETPGLYERFVAADAPRAFTEPAAVERAHRDRRVAEADFVAAASAYAESVGVSVADGMVELAAADPTAYNAAVDATTARRGVTAAVTRDPDEVEAEIADIKAALRAQYGSPTEER